MKGLSGFLNIVMAFTLIGVNAGLARARDGGGPEDKTAAPKSAAVEESIQVTVRFPLASPLFSDVPVAAVNEEPIQLEELKNALVFSHAKDLEGTSKTSQIDFQIFLDRLITIRLFTDEARNVGIDELPEIRNSLEKFSGATLRQLYVAEHIKNVKADPAEAERIYKEKVKEWKIQSVAFNKEENAKKMKTDLKAGKPFEEAAAKALAEDKGATGSEKADWVLASSLQAHVAKALSDMKPGSVSPILTTGAGRFLRYTLLKLEDVRYPDNPVEREQAEKKAENDAKQRVLDKYKKDLYKKYVKINKQRLASIDYEAKKPGMKQLEKDKRVLAELPGKKITVGDLTAALKTAFYHGADVAAQNKKLNSEKQLVLEDVIDKQILQTEALKHGTDKTRQYRALVKEFETNLLFDTFVEKVIRPEVKVTEDEKKAYYQEHRKDFTPPPSLKLASLVFKTEKDAKTAREKLKKGADFNWMKENAEGQVKEAETWKGEAVTVQDLAPEIGKALADAKAGDFRLAQRHEGQYDVIAILDVIPSDVLPFEKLEPFIEKRVAGVKLDKVAKEWSDRLRKSSKITIYMTKSSN